MKAESKVYTAKMWAVKSTISEGILLCNLKFTRDAAREHASELRRHLPGKWEVFPVNVEVTRR